MVVAKRQRKEKANKNGTKENLRTRLRTLGETAFWASPIYIGQAQGEEKKHINRGAKIEPLSFWVSLSSHLEGALSFVCQIKLSRNQAITLVHYFKSLLL